MTESKRGAAKHMRSWGSEIKSMMGTNITPPQEKSLGTQKKRSIYARQCKGVG